MIPVVDKSFYRISASYRGRTAIATRSNHGWHVPIRARERHRFRTDSLGLRHLKTVGKELDWLTADTDAEALALVQRLVGARTEG